MICFFRDLMLFEQEADNLYAEEFVIIDLGCQAVKVC